MRIKKIKITNFYSIESMELDLNKYKGITLIEGYNKDVGGSNGSGKSSILEAVCWGLTGKTIRKSTEAALVNNKNKRNCSVEIVLSGNRIIKRQRKPTFLEFFIGKENRTKASVPDTQKEIEEVLGITHKSLLCTTFFGQHNGYEFLDSTPEDKRNIINSFLNLDGILEKRKIVKGLKSEYYQDAKVQVSLIKEYSKSIEDITKKKEVVKKLSKEYEDKYDSILEFSLEDILDIESRWLSVNSEIALLKQKIYNQNQGKVILQNTLDHPKKQELCSACGQNKPALSLKEVKASITVCSDNISNLEKEIDELLSNSQKPQVSSRDYYKIEEYRNLKREISTYDIFVEELQEKIKETEKKQYNSDTLYEVMKFWEKAFSEQGVIKYIIRNVLDYFNSKCNYYLSFLCNNSYILEFDEELNEKIKTRGEEIQYISLSGGEKRKINLAVLMGLKDLFVLNDSYDSDFLFFDEIAENLDKEGIDGLFNLLQEIKKSKDIFVITHNKYLKSNLDSANRISIIKESGSSTAQE